MYENPFTGSNLKCINNVFKLFSSILSKSSVCVPYVRPELRLVKDKRSRKPFLMQFGHECVEFCGF